jgi:hypothetical protein
MGTVRSPQPIVPAGGIIAKAMSWGVEGPVFNIRIRRVKVESDRWRENTKERQEGFVQL